MEIVAFGSKDIENSLATMDTEALDNLAFGAIQLDGKGTIIKYNQTEGEICNRDPKEVIGRNFFTDVAPCTNTRGFKGKFDEGVSSGKLNTLFQYTFDYNMKPTRVNVHLKKASNHDDRYWVIVKRM
ncbi:MAG: photoactive yellow protein [Alphaproteobacteria bacterium]